MGQHTPVANLPFKQLLSHAEQHETAVIDALRRRQWTAEKFGQGQLTEPLRNLLRHVNTHVRWLPDIIAARETPSATQIVFIDAKAGDTHMRTGNHAIQISALEASEKWIEFTNHCCAYFYVFADGAVCTPGDVRESCWDGRYLGNGSGTPFKVFPAAVCRPFDTVFGSASA